MNDSNLPPTIPSADALPTAIEIATSSASVSREHALALLHFVAVGRRWEDSARTGWRRVADLTSQLDETAKQRDEAREQREASEHVLYARLTAKQAELDDALGELRAELDEAREQRAADARVAQCKLAAKETEASLTRQSLAEARAECYDLRRERDEARAEADELRGELERAREMIAGHREMIAEQRRSIATHIASANQNLANYSRVACDLDSLRFELRKLGGAQ